ncbi:acyl carrier protein [Dolosicoccus paucivorans]|uniref:Acyl carrier protein n=1 Tax=Dolosicoccus paucivorans TaxID=84521 RepID=A0A1G8JR77_9LACT|nr:acyl carrier protein [Dolosicoccus paucivorans]PMB83893.1 acyl carrier protein [Dolosicoccus paucivorans]PMC58052.1 acyl carrier protein [Dolosicoccus paucivorans]SDI33685.1 acyl carrier protein [Dolosicoccus paucivorans]
MVFEKVKEIIVDELGIEEDEVTPETNFEEDLKADSLDVFQIISEIEDELDITIDTDQNLQTVQDLVDYIEGLQQ